MKVTYSVEIKKSKGYVFLNIILNYLFPATFFYFAGMIGANKFIGFFFFLLGIFTLVMRIELI